MTDTGPLTYIYKQRSIFRTVSLLQEGLLSDAYLDGVKVGRIIILPQEQYGSKYDTLKLESLGAMVGLWINDPTGIYTKQWRAGKIFAGIEVKAYTHAIVEAKILMEDPVG